MSSILDDTQPIPPRVGPWAYVLAVVVGFLFVRAIIAFASAFTLIIFPDAGLWMLLPMLGLSTLGLAALGAMFGYRWPSPGWHWGLWLGIPALNPLAIVAAGIGAHLASKRAMRSKSSTP